MSAFEDLKSELIKQKDAIIDGGGQVRVAKDYPSPTEITKGITTLHGVDFSVATAREGDVAQGKTFYAEDRNLKTGTATIDMDIWNALFMSPYESVSYDGEIYYSTPATLKTLRRYAFFNNYNNITITLNDDLEKIDDFAFYKCKNITINNFDDLPKLRAIGQDGFYQAGCKGMDFTHLPNTVTTIDLYAFAEVVPQSLDYRFPDALKNLSSGVYMQSKRLLAETLDLSNYKITYLSSNSFYYVAFNCDFNQPDSVSMILEAFNKRGCFRNIKFNSNLKNLATECFGSFSSDPISNFYLETVEFEGETPPYFGSNVFAKQNIENGFKIYVPDVALEEYKAVANLSSYVNNIYPKSQMN